MPPKLDNFRSEAGVSVKPWTNLETDIEMWSQCTSERQSDAHALQSCQLASSISLPPKFFSITVVPSFGFESSNWDVGIRRFEASKPTEIHQRPVCKSYHAVFHERL